MQGNQGSQVPSDLELGSCPFSEAMKPKGHEKYGDASKCPFKQQQPEVKVVESSDKKQKKEKKPRGGCPFMPSEGKRNPELTHLEFNYDTYFVSPLNYLLDTRGLWMLAFDSKEARKGPIKERRKQFEQYPIYLKHTLFHEEENTKKMRSLEVAQRFFVYDKFREKGNKLMNKKQYDEAIRYYERALGCFRWLEVVEPPEVESEEEIDNEVQDETLSEKDQKELKESKEQVKQYKKEQKDFKKQYKSLMTIYTDDNVKHRGVHDLEDTADKEMCNSMLFTLYINMGVCYMQMCHFQLARQVLADAASISADNSHLMFRQSQAILYDRWSSFKDIIKAKETIEKAIDLSNYEKIFKQEPGILKLMGLENARQMYVEHAHKVMDRIKEYKKWMTDIIDPLFERALEIDEIEKEMIEDGKTPFEEGVTDVIEIAHEVDPNEDAKQVLYRECLPQLAEEHQEYEIVKEMVNKYYRIIEFYAEQKKFDQVNIAKRELQKLMETVNTMHYYMNVDFIDFENDEVIKEVNQKYKLDLKSKKIIRRLARLCREQVTEIFGQGKFNFEVFEYAMTDYFKKKREEQDKILKQQQEDEPVKPKRESEFLKKTLFSSEFWMQMFILILVMGGMYYFTNNTGLIGKVFSIKK